MARLDKTIKDYQQQLKDKGIKDIPEFIQSILDVDMTKGKYSRFLLDCYIDDKFRKEDLQGGVESTVGQTISLFHKHKSKLPEDMRSIYKYDSPGSLWSAVKQFNGELSGKEVKREEQDRIYGETEFVYEDENTGFKIVSPLTEDAAKWWGKGTRWCTSAEKNNAFKDYAEQSPLLIFLMPEGEKIQLWKDKYDIQFMDEADNEVELRYIYQNWGVLEPVIKWIGDLRYVPEDMKTEEICKIAIQKMSNNLKYVPEKFLTEEICQLAVEKDREALKYIPNFRITEDLYQIAMQNYGYSIQYIPKKLRTEKLCKIAVKQDGSALEFVPDEMKTKEMCKIAVEQNGSVIEHIPQKFITDELCKIAVQQNGWALQYVPMKFITEEICQLAVQQNGYSIEAVPKEFMTDETFKIALKQDGDTLYFIPQEFITEEICRIAIQNGNYTLRYIPEIFKTEEICKLVVQKNGCGIFDMPDHMKTEEIYQIAVQQNGVVLEIVPEQLKTKEMCKHAVQQNEEYLLFVPEQWKEQMKQYIKPKIIQIPEDKYQQVFSEIRSFFPEKSLSLTM